MLKLHYDNNKKLYFVWRNYTDTIDLKKADNLHVTCTVRSDWHFFRKSKSNDKMNLIICILIQTLLIRFLVISMIRNFKKWRYNAEQLCYHSNTVEFISNIAYCEYKITELSMSLLLLSIICPVSGNSVWTRSSRLHTSLAALSPVSIAV